MVAWRITRYNDVTCITVAHHEGVSRHIKHYKTSGILVTTRKRRCQNGMRTHNECVQR